MKKRMHVSLLTAALACVAMNLTVTTARADVVPTVCTVTGRVSITPTSHLLTGGVSGAFSVDPGLPNTAVCAGAHIGGGLGALSAGGSFDAETLKPLTIVNTGYQAGPCGGTASGNAYGAVAVLVLTGAEPCGNGGAAVATFSVNPLTDIDTDCSQEFHDICLKGAELVGVFVQLEIPEP